jgi:hypothetical protein
MSTVGWQPVAIFVGTVSWFWGRVADAAAHVILEFKSLKGEGRPA